MHNVGWDLGIVGKQISIDGALRWRILPSKIY
jgi:hypothetical protein